MERARAPAREPVDGGGLRRRRSNLGPLLWTRRPEHWQFLSVNLGLGTMPSRNSRDDQQRGHRRSPSTSSGCRRRSDDVPRHHRGAGHREPVLLRRARHRRRRSPSRPTPPAACSCSSPDCTRRPSSSSPPIVSSTLDARVRVAQVAAAHRHRRTARSRSPTSPTARRPAAPSLSALEELIATRSQGQASCRGAMMLEKSALVAGASAGDGAEVATPPPPRPPPSLLLISDDAPVDRARLVQLAERAADAGVYPIWVADDVSRACPPSPAPIVESSTTDRTARVGLVRLGDDDRRRRHRADHPRAGPALRAPARPRHRRRRRSSRDSSDLPALGHRCCRSLGPSSRRPSSGRRRPLAAERLHPRPLRRPARSAAAPASCARSSARPASTPCTSTCAPRARTRSSAAPPAPARASSCRPGCSAWPPSTAPTASPSCSSTTRAARPSPTASTLPHCVGLVTDLSPHLVRRALTSPARRAAPPRAPASTARRRRTCSSSRSAATRSAPPALVLVIDEFAALAGEVPGVRRRRRRHRPARSLARHPPHHGHPAPGRRHQGQPARQHQPAHRPAHGRRVGLAWTSSATRSPAPSTRRSPAAASPRPAPAASPRSSRPTRAAGRATTPAAPSVEVAELRFGAEHALGGRPAARSRSRRERDPGPTDQRALVAQPRRRGEGGRASRRPAARGSTSSRPSSTSPSCASAPTPSSLLGVADLPAAAAAAGGRTSGRTSTATSPIFGTGGSGKTAALRTLAAAGGHHAARRPGRRLRPRLRHRRPPDARGAAARRLDRAGRRPGARRPPAAHAARASSRIAQRPLRRGQRRHRSSTTAASRTPPTSAASCCCVDDFPALPQDFEVGAARARLVRGVPADPRPRAAASACTSRITADRPGSVPDRHRVDVPAPGRAAPRRRGRLHAARRARPTSSRPPRLPGARSSTALETQVAIVGGDPNVAEQSKALATLAEAIVAHRPRAGRRGRRRCRPRSRPRRCPTTSTACPVLGVSDDTLAPIGFEPTGAFVLAGPPASGRTNALRWLISSVRTRRRRSSPGTTSAPRAPRSGSRPGWEATATTVEDVAALAKELAATRRRDERHARSSSSSSRSATSSPPPPTTRWSS